MKRSQRTKDPGTSLPEQEEEKVGVAMDMERIVSAEVREARMPVLMAKKDIGTSSEDQMTLRTMILQNQKSTLTEIEYRSELLKQ
jgi:hypothetical protein